MQSAREISFWDQKGTHVDGAWKNRIVLVQIAVCDQGGHSRAVDSVSGWNSFGPPVNVIHAQPSVEQNVVF
jgi:hypothetical protein